jgi:hypothetical protein
LAFGGFSASKNGMAGRFPTLTFIFPKIVKSQQKAKGFCFLFKDSSQK